MPPSIGQPTMIPQVTVTRPATSLDKIFMTSSNWSWLSSLPDLLSFAYCARTSSTEWRFGGLTAPMTRMALLTCVEINQCVGCTRQFFPKSFLGNDAAVLARSKGEEPASPRHRAGVASMAWRP